MAEKRDYYEVLGVQKGASKDQIKDAYRNLAMQFHPDRNKDVGAEERFKEISEAYAVLIRRPKTPTIRSAWPSGFDQRYKQKTFSEEQTSTQFSETWVLAMFSEPFLVAVEASAGL